jgi:hypothetical protein
MQTARSAGPYKTGPCGLNYTSPEPFCVVNMTDDAQSLSEQCGTSVHATEALLCNLWEQKIKHCWPALACDRDRCRPGSWSGLTDPTMIPCRKLSITFPGGVVGAAPSVEVLAGSAEPPPPPTLTSRLEGGLQVVVSTAVHDPLGGGSGRLCRQGNSHCRANVLGTR